MIFIESRDEIPNSDGLKFLTLTLRPGDMANIGKAKVMLRRVKGREVRLVIAAPEDVLVRLVKKVQNERDG